MMAMKMLRVDCTTGEVTERDLTEAEVDAHEQATQGHERAQAARRDQQAADHALIRQRAAEDPVFAALARQLGVPEDPVPGTV